MSNPEELQPNPEGLEANPEEFFFDDFFANDEGIEVRIKIRGKDVPMTIKPNISLSDRDAAAGRALRREFNNQTGKIEVKGIDAKRMNGELMAAAIVKWPFKQRDGKKVPITAENCMKLLVEGADQILLILKDGREAKLEALDPFAVS